MLEQPELGAPLIVTLTKAELAKSDGTKDAKCETVEGAAVPEHLKSWTRHLHLSYFSANLASREIKLNWYRPRSIRFQSV